MESSVARVTAQSGPGQNTAATEAHHVMNTQTRAHTRDSHNA